MKEQRRGATAMVFANDPKPQNNHKRLPYQNPFSLAQEAMSPKRDFKEQFHDH